MKSDANGRVFKWYAPVNGIRQGSYEPVKLLTSPKKKQMITLGADYKLSKNTFITTEVALSNNNINTFSDSDRNNDVGMASHLLAEHTININSTDSSGWKMGIGCFYDHTSKNFTYIEPYRPVEFQRDWNILDQNSVMENYTGAHMKFFNLKC